MQNQSKILDHLGLVAALYDDLEIGQQIDHLITRGTRDEWQLAHRSETVGEGEQAVTFSRAFCGVF